MKPKNLPASVHDRLLERAHQEKRPFQELLEYYGMERFLYRLSKSVHAERFVLKGALMLRVWDAPAARPTRDIDLLGRLHNAPENLARVVAAVCEAEVEPDGLLFKAATVKAIRIKEDADYEGVRGSVPRAARQVEDPNADRRRLRRCRGSGGQGDQLSDAARVSRTEAEGLPA